jgi:hypothetical protein
VCRTTTAGLQISDLHHGNYVLQSIAGHQEILGPDVTVAHLLLKNHVREVVGRSATRS